MPDRVTVYILEPDDRPYLQAQWLDPTTGKRRTRSLKTTDPGKAETARADLEYELNNDLYEHPSRMTWEAFRPVYCDERLAGLRKSTQRKAQGIFDRFERTSKPGKLGELSARTFSVYASQMRKDGDQPATIASHLAYLRAALRWAKKQEFIASVPLIELPKVPKKRRWKTIDEGQFQTLEAGVPAGEWRLFAQVLWYTGMRIGEAQLLEWSEPTQDDRCWIDLAAGKIRIPAEACKGDAESWLPVHPNLLPHLEAARQPAGSLFSFHAFNGRTASKWFKRHAHAAGVLITAHDVRRSFGTRYAQVVPAQVLQRLMRHADIKTTLAYYADMDKGLDEAIRRL